MAKIIGPAMSLSAHGVIHKKIVFQKTRGGHKVYIDHSHKGLETPSQIARKAQFLDCIIQWKALDQTEKDQYNEDAKFKGMTGYNLFMVSCLQPGGTPAPPPTPPNNFVNPQYETDLGSWNAGNDPVGIAGNLWTWLDANQIVGNDNDPVGTWPDLSGNAYDLTEATNKPTLKTGIFTGIDSVARKVVRFDSGSWNAMANTGTPALGASAYTMIVLLNSHVIGGDYRTSLYLNPQAMDVDPLNTWEFGRGGGADLNPTSPVFSANEKMLCTLKRIVNGGSVQYAYMQGAPQDPASANNNTVLTGPYGIGKWPAGAFYYWDGDVAECIIYSRNLSDTEQSLINSYLAFKWGIVLTGNGGNVTRDTSVKRTGNASAKIETFASNSDTPFYEKITPGIIDDCELIGYARTDGGAVTSDDVQLYYDGSAIATTYTPDADGWYKMNATVSGSMTEKKVGVIVKSNKSVNIDDMDFTNA